MKPALPFLELMATNVCNLACEGCTTFSDLDHKGYATWQQSQQQLDPWLARLDIQAVGFMGGEPLINPDLRAWIFGLRDLLPRAQIRFVTNGLLLDKHWWVIDALDQVGNAVMKITYHLPNHALDRSIERIFGSRDWQPIQEFGIDRWIAPSGLRFQIARPQRFIKTYQGQLAHMTPHDSDPTKSFAICVQQKCPMLYQGRLYKCGTAALTPEIINRHGRPNIEKWRPYIETGLAADCEPPALEKFLANFGKPHAICRQCPTDQDCQSLIDHTKTVRLK